jgi:hypothetical protein
MWHFNPILNRNFLLPCCFFPDLLAYFRLFIFKLSILKTFSICHSFSLTVTARKCSSPVQNMAVSRFYFILFFGIKIYFRLLKLSSERKYWLLRTFLKIFGSCYLKYRTVPYEEYVKCINWTHTEKSHVSVIKNVWTRRMSRFRLCTLRLMF